MTDTVRRCPRCGFRGDGVPYFRRPSHVALLAGVGLFTYGIGGVIYWMVKRNHLVCANCGLGWEHASLGRAWDRSNDALPSGRFEASGPEPTLPRSGLGRRILGGVMGLASVVLVTAGIANAAAAAIVTGGVVGLTAGASFLWGWTSLQARRQALLTALQRRVLLLASSRGGFLTVTEVAAQLNLNMASAERVLVAMDDGFRVRSDVTDEGIVLYEFPELQRSGLQPPPLEPRETPRSFPPQPPSSSLDA